MRVPFLIAFLIALSACAPSEPGFFDDTISGPLELDVRVGGAAVEEGVLTVWGVVYTVSPPGEMPGVPITLVPDGRGEVLVGVLTDGHGRFSLSAPFESGDAVWLEASGGTYQTWRRPVSEILSQQ